MERRKVYWAVGIIIAIILAFIWIFGTKGTAVQKGGIVSQESQEQTGGVADSGVEISHDMHEGMDHGIAANADDTADKQAVTQYLQEQESIMADMMEKMNAVEKSESADITFLKGMLPHHDSAIEMANSYLRHGRESESLKKLAENIVKVQEEEVGQMQTMIQALEKDGKKDANKETAYLAEYQTMMEKHHRMSHTAGDSVEKAFAEGMIMHHQMAIDMAKSILNHTEEDEVKTLAQNIIDAQEKEITEMQEIIENL